MLCSASYYFHLKLWSSYSYIATCIHPIKVCRNARTIHNTHGSSYNFKISISNCTESVMLLNRVLHWMQQVNIREILWSHQVPPTTHINRTFTQHPKINFPKLIVHSGNSGKFALYLHLGKITCYTAATLAWEHVPEFKIVRTRTMSCIFSY